MDTGEAGHHGPAVEVTAKCQEPDCVTIQLLRMEALNVHTVVKRKECAVEEPVLVTRKVLDNLNFVYYSEEWRLGRVVTMVIL